MVTTRIGAGLAGRVRQAAVIAWLSLATTATAQQDDAALSEQDFLTDLPVVLSVSRLSQPLAEAPAPVTVIDRDMIKASGFRELADLFRLVPGFLVTHSRGGLPSVIYGIDDDFARRMQVLVDGRSIYTPSFGGVEWFNLPIELEDIERVEVIRGPNAAAYGANSFFGVINIITRHASQDPGTYGALLGGSNDFAQGMLRYAGSSGAVNYRLSLGYLQDGGLQSRFDSIRQKRLSTRVDYQLSSRDALQLHAGVSDGNNALGRPTSTSDPVRKENMNSYFAQVRWHRQLSDDTEFSLQYYHTHYRTIDEYGIDVPPVLFDFMVDQNRSATRDNVEFQHTLTLNPKLRAVWGLEARRDEVASPRFFNVPGAVKNDLYRVFGTGEWRLNDKLISNLGLMWEHNDLTGADWSPRLALNYHLAAGHTLRASVSRALRTPVLAEERADNVYRIDTPLGTLVDRFLFSSGGLKPERITSYELGYVAELLPQRLFVDARVHHDKVRDIITQVPRNVPPTLDNSDGRVFDFANTDSATLTGFETQLRWVHAPRWRVIGNYAYTRVKSTDRVDQISRSVPKHNAGVLAIAQLPKDFALSVGAYRQTKARWIGGDNLPGYSKVDLRLSKTMRFGSARGELALGLQDVWGDYIDFQDDNLRKARGYIAFGVQF